MPAGRGRRKDNLWDAYRVGTEDNKETLTGDSKSERIPVWVRIWSNKKPFALHWNASLARTCVTFDRMWVSGGPLCFATNFLF